MGREVERDEFGMELTKEEIEENERITQGAWDAIKDNITPRAEIKKKGGWPKGKPRKAPEEESKTEEIAPAQVTDPMDVKVPEAVRNACVNRIEELERLMQDVNVKIDELKAQNRDYEGEYKVLAEFVFKKGK